MWSARFFRQQKPAAIGSARQFSTAIGTRFCTCMTPSTKLAPLDRLRQDLPRPCSGETDTRAVHRSRDAGTTVIHMIAAGAQTAPVSSRHPERLPAMR
jgi:hypothetical protein